MRSIVAVLGLCIAAAAGAAPDAVLAPEAKVAGKNAAEYSAQWWQWAMRVPGGMRPYEDRDGSTCAAGQEGPVWFLAGTNGSARVERKCTVPAGKHVFFPVINMVGYSSGAPRRNCAQVSADVAANNDHLQHAIVKVDDVAVDDVRRFRARTEACFDLFARATYMKDTARFYPAASDGFWIMLKPLPPGRHRISVRANYANPQKAYGDMIQFFDYELNVVPPGV